VSKNGYPELCKALDAARAGFAGYRSECVLFAAQFTRGLVEYAGWPRELVTYEAAWEGVAGPGEAQVTQTPEDAMRLDEDGFWHFALRLVLQGKGAKGLDRIKLEVRFKKLETRYIMSLFGFEDFEVAAPTPENLQPIYDSIFNAVKRHYDYGLRLFLENGGRGLKIPISAARLGEMAHGHAVSPAPGGGAAGSGMGA
jgi:hypothetical protein